MGGGGGEVLGHRLEGLSSPEMEMTVCLEQWVVMSVVVSVDRRSTGWQHTSSPEG